jgi:hypothetical protein
MYHQLGYDDLGNCTLFEAFGCNGDAHMLPEDGESDRVKYHSRFGLILEKVSG